VEPTGFLVLTGLLVLTGFLVLGSRGRSAGLDGATTNAAVGIMLPRFSSEPYLDFWYCPKGWGERYAVSPASAAVGPTRNADPMTQAAEKGIRPELALATRGACIWLNHRRLWCKEEACTGTV